MTNTANDEFERLLGRAALEIWNKLSRDDQELLFECAIRENQQFRLPLAKLLHEHHPKTAHPFKPPSTS